METVTRVKEGWQGDTIVAFFKYSQTKPKLKGFKSLPLIVAWGIWLARNTSIFEDGLIPPFRCAAQS